ncbi:MAG: VWA domain-containing protein [Gammaproteobacteria bacterium]|nr:VWA domain-containing protein [Gammaproteobacteria bacterium]
MRLSYQSRITASALLMLLVLFLIMSALWFPRTDRTIKVMDLLFVLDITQSMDVVDVEKDSDTISRLTWAKDYTRQTLQTLPCGSHVGLAVFSESRSLILMNPVEVCDSYHDLTQMIDKINGPMAWALSSEISKAAFTAIDQAKLMKPKPSVVFITDGHESPPLHKTLYPKYKGSAGQVSGVFVGVGGDKLVPIPKHDLDGNDVGFWQENEVLHQDVYAASRGDVSEELGGGVSRTEHLSSLKQSHIKQLATMLDFEYVISPSKPTSLINTLEQNSEHRDQNVSYDWSLWFAAIALFILVLLYSPYNRSRDGSVSD